MISVALLVTYSANISKPICISGHTVKELFSHVLGMQLPGVSFSLLAVWYSGIGEYDMTLRKPALLSIIVLKYSLNWCSDLSHHWWKPQNGRNCHLVPRASLDSSVFPERCTFYIFSKRRFGLNMRSKEKESDGRNKYFLPGRKEISVGGWFIPWLSH